MSGTDELRESLREVLAAEERLYVEMRDLLQGERELMVELDGPGLEQVALQKATLADEGRLIEESRLELCASLAAALGLPENRPTLSRLCEELREDGAPLREIHNRLVVLVSVVRELGDANSVFAGDCLSQVRGTLQLLGRLLPENPIYGSEAAGQPEFGSGRLVRRTA